MRSTLNTRQIAEDGAKKKLQMAAASIVILQLQLRSLASERGAGVDRVRATEIEESVIGNGTTEARETIVEGMMI